MDRIEHAATSKTPYVLLDPNGRIKLKGRSIPEDVALFYDDILVWVLDYCDAPAPLTEVDVQMEYLNSGTSKYMLKILKVIKDIHINGNELKINWVYEEGDDDIRERGEYYATILDLRINFIEIE